MCMSSPHKVWERVQNLSPSTERFPSGKHKVADNVRAAYEKIIFVNTSGTAVMLTKLAYRVAGRVQVLYSA